MIGALIFAAAYVYRIKMESTARVERVLRLRAEIREQRDAIAVLRSEWARARRAAAPAGARGTSSGAEADQRHANTDSLKNLPERPPSLVRPGDPIRSAR